MLLATFLAILILMPENIPDLDNSSQISIATTTSGAEKTSSNNVTSNTINPVLKKQWHIIAFALGAFTLILGIFIILGVQFLKSKMPETKNTIATGNSTISGTFDINGVIPTNASISISATDMSSGITQSIGKNILPQDGDTWNFTNALKGNEYKIVASVIVSGTTLQKSNSLIIIAPADGEVLKLNIPNKTQNDGDSAIAGSLNLNGYFPPNSTISIQARALGTSSFKTVISNVPAVDLGVWNWTSAELGSTYELQAVLTGASTNTSEIQEITAPATGEVFTINSNLNPPTPTSVGLSGTFNINGTVPNNAFISLATRATGTTAFNQVATNLSATNGTTWSWNSAQSGTSYDIQAYIWSNGTPYTSSQIVTVTAAANNETITLNAMTPPSNTPPGSSISISCNGSNPANGLWAVNISYNNNNAITNAQQYNLTIGNTGGGNQFITNTTTPSNPNGPQNYTTAYVFNAGQTYYAQYAYATCQNCNTFSNYSPSIQFSCSTPYASPTPIPTP